MALTVHYSILCTVSDAAGNVVAEWKARDNSVTTSGDNHIAGAMNTSTGAAAVPLGTTTALGSGGLALFRNRGTTAGQIITLQSASGDDTVILAPGHEHLTALDVTGMAAFTATAAAGTPILDYLIIDP